jgi:uncharacterized membrane protein (Fun14 family)
LIFGQNVAKKLQVALHVEQSRVFSSKILAITQVAGSFLVVTVMGYCLNQTTGPGGTGCFKINI